MDLKPLAKTLLEQSLDLALACGVPPDDLVDIFDGVVRARIPVFAGWSDSSPRVKDVLDLTCFSAETIVQFLLALRPDHLRIPRGDLDGPDRQGPPEGPGPDLPAVSPGSALAPVPEGLPPEPSPGLSGLPLPPHPVPPSDL
jgi:hypothetical protein